MDSCLALFEADEPWRPKHIVRKLYVTLHAMSCVFGLIAVRVMRERRDHVHVLFASGGRGRGDILKVPQPVCLYMVK